MASPLHLLARIAHTRRGKVRFSLRVPIAVIIVAFFAVVLVLVLFFLDGLFSKQDIGGYVEIRSISGSTWSKESAHSQWYASPSLDNAILQEPFTCYHSDGGGYVFLLFQVF